MRQRGGGTTGTMRKFLWLAACVAAGANGLKIPEAKRDAVAGETARKVAARTQTTVTRPAFEQEFAARIKDDLDAPPESLLHWNESSSACPPTRAFSLLMTALLSRSRAPLADTRAARATRSALCVSLENTPRRPKRLSARSRGKATSSWTKAPRRK